MKIPESEKIKFKFADIALIVTMIMLIGIGLISIYSATSGQSNSSVSNNFQHQIYWIFSGLTLFLFTLTMSPKFYQAFVYIFYGFIIFCLLAVLLVGKSSSGADRWLSFFGFNFQPSEWAKIATIFALARYLSDNQYKFNKIRQLLISFGIGFLPMLLIFKQPDLGTSLVFLVIIPSMMYWVGISPLILFLTFVPALTMIASFKLWSFFLVMGILIVVLYYADKKLKFSISHIFLNIIVGVATPFLWASLKTYQQARVLSFLGIVNDPQGISYQVIQSKVAIGSGGFTGKGFLAGTQTQLRFLPEQHTDFIFSVIGEEFGFIGCMVIIALFVFLLLRGLQVAISVKNRFTSLVAIGIVTMFAYHYFVNIGMVMGVLPVTGLPLPFISYGGSFLNTSMVSVALLLNFSVRKHQY